MLALVLCRDHVFALILTPPQMLLHKLRAANSANMQLVLENKNLMESSKVGPYVG